MTNLFLTFFGISISVSLMVIVLMIFTPVFNKRYAAKWKYMIWLFLALRLLLPFSSENMSIVFDMIAQTETQTAPKAKERDANAQISERPSGRIIVEIPAQMTAPKRSTDFTILDLVTFLWMIGGLIFLSVHGISYFHCKREVMKKGKAAADANILRQICELKRELKIKRTIRAIQYSESVSPMIIGFFKPVLVLPKQQYSMEELSFILKHELVHLKRGDIYAKLLFVIVNALHWFNPFIWIMQKESVIDMELSCDERVTEGACYAVRKAYTETLLSMLHKQCTGRTALSTQFYGGKKIMKRRFQNILVKRKKKNGIILLLCSVILILNFGTLAGCSVAKEDTEKSDAGRESTGMKDTDHLSERSEGKELSIKYTPDERLDDDNHSLENTTTLTFLKEGLQEQKQAVLAAGDGYFLFLPKDEWQSSGPDFWRAAVNEQVGLWIRHFADESIESVNQKLEEEGYATVQDYSKRRQEENLICDVQLKVYENNIWGIFYCYPTDAKEGWGRELPVIADTFAVTVNGDEQRKNDTGDAAGVLQAMDCQEIRTIVEEFSAAYFDGNTDDIKQFLADTYEGEIETYESTGAVSDFTVKGLSDSDDKKAENGECAVSLEFRDSACDDILLYLTFLFVRQDTGWKIQFYGLEG